MRSDIKLADAYYRLSSEESNRGESSSITNQRTLVQTYCAEHGICLVAEFVDDGFSGSNFDRPGFKQLLAHLEAGKANMVITKDLSRLGRDMAESSSYAERYFPEHGIHYVAISDNFDSDAVNLMAPFQFAMNDVYLRDTSRKVRQVLDSKKRHGQYCACPPYGYMKDPKRRDRLVPDEATAPVVRRIFSLAANGASTRSIAARLSEEGAVPPLKYRALYRDDFSDEGAARACDEWNCTTVKRILCNQVYLGHTVLGKTRKLSVKSKMKTKLPEDEWIITRNTHEPLITLEQFERAKQFLGSNSRKTSGDTQCRSSIFKGIAHCASCGAAMSSGGTVYNGERERYWYLSCNNLPSRSPKRCEHGARIRYGDLIELVRLDLNRVLSLTDGDIAAIGEAAAARLANCPDNGDKPENIEKRLAEIDRIVAKLYHDNITGRIDDERLERLIAELNKESKALEARAQKQKESRREQEELKSSCEAFFALAKEYSHIETLTSDIVRTFIERIEIGEKLPVPKGKSTRERAAYRQNVRIFYRFVGELPRPSLDELSQPLDEAKHAGGQ